MKRWDIALVALSCLALTGCIGISDWKSIRGSGFVQSEDRTVSGFDRVSVAGSGELSVTQGAQESLTIQADDNLLPYIQSEVKNGVLHLGPHNVNLRSSKPIHYTLTVKELREANLSGSVRAAVESLKTDRLVLSISGSGRVNINHLEAGNFVTHISGSGNTTASGIAERQEISISGSGNHQTPELKSAQVKASISGSGNASLWVTDSLTASISGSGRVEYRGTAHVKASVSGSGRVSHRDGPEASLQ